MTGKDPTGDKSAPGLEPTLAPSDPGLEATSAATAEAGGSGAAPGGGIDPTRAPSSSPRRGEQSFPTATRLGRYVIVSKLGAGGMGIVYAAYDPELDRKVALKLVRGTSGEGSQRLLREAQAMAKLSHPNVIPVHDVGTVGDQIFVAMEFVDGVNLAAWLVAQQRSWQAVRDIFMAAGRGLAAAHAAGLVHRDFKPDNVLVGKDGRVRVLDFGLARGTGGEHAPDQPLAPPGAAQPTPALATGSVGGSVTGSVTGSTTGARQSMLDTPLTQMGTIMGTPAYMAPEQHLGIATDPRTDQFSFCVALHEGLYGGRPFSGATVRDLAAEVMRGRVKEPPADSHVPPWLRAIVLRGLAVDPLNRWPSMDELLGELARDPRVRRRRIALAAGVLALVAGTAVVATQMSTPAAPIVVAAPVPCQGAEARLAGVWDEARKTDVRRAFLASDSPIADQAWPRVEATLNAWAAEWVAMTTAACEATRVAGTQSEELLDRRMFCLDGRRDELASLTAELARADRDVVGRAAQAAHALPSVDECANMAALTARIRPPTDAAVRKQVEEVRKSLADAHALGLAGKYPQGLAVAQPLVAAAHELGYLPLEAEALFRRGHLEHCTGGLEESAKTHVATLRLADRAGDDVLRARAAIELVATVGYEQARPADGHEWARTAEGILERAGGDDLLTADLCNSEGQVFLSESKLAEARGLFERALVLREQVDGPKDVGVAATLVNLAIVYTEEGKLDDAVTALGRALAIFEQEYGPDHPNVGILLTNLGGAYYMLDRPEEARVALERSLAVLEKSMGPKHVYVADPLINLGNVHDDAGRFAEAEAAYERARAILEEAEGSESPRAAMVLKNMGDMNSRRGNQALARTQVERALAIRLEVFGPDHPGVASAHYTLGAIAMAEGKLDEAERHHRLALGIYQKAYGADHPDVADSHDALGQVHLAQRRWRDALAAHGRALAIRPAVVSYVGVANTHLASGAPAKAIAPAEAAFAIDTDPAEHALAGFTLARALWDADRDRPRARTLATDAHAAFAAAGPHHEKDTAQVAAWLAARPATTK